MENNLHTLTVTVLKSGELKLATGLTVHYETISRELFTHFLKGYAGESGCAVRFVTEC